MQRTKSGNLAKETYICWGPCIDIDAPELELLSSVRQADVIVTTTERSDLVRNLHGAAGKTIITVGDPNDVSLLLRLKQP